ncbi:MAG: DUF1566 domain-containing protein [Nanoarchaeota archaeon]
MKIKNLLVSVFVMIIIVIVLVVVFPQEKTGSAINENSKTKNCGDGTTFYEGENLCWQKSAKPEPAKNWGDANDYCANLNLGKKDDWRLPEIDELRSLVTIVPPEQVTIDTDFFTDTQTDYYWTATDYPNPKKENTHWYVYFKTGYDGIAPDFKANYEARCVRDNKLS